MTQLGFIGLGEMGGRITSRLLQAGYPVIGYNRTRSKAQWLLEAGMTWAESPREVAEKAEIIFSMVTNTSALREITTGESGVLPALRRGKIFLDMSTVSPSYSREIAEQVTSQGASMLDVPVSGSVVTVEQGNLSLMVGGDRAVFEQIRSYLLAIGPKVNYVGKNGQALLMKIAINLSLAVQFQAFSEGILLAEKGGIPREVALETWLNSVLASPALKYRAPFILEKSPPAWFNVNMMQKDLLLALELGRELDVPLSSVAIANELLTTTRALGLAQEDFSIIFETLARLSGINA